mmetsp:Transcript_30336/g.93890  ORF Transcript_30336/g.93890 Transcript_30336/m.93890 type:complete len:120 (+) Transcript_30336:661-1020(+)
MHENIPAKHIRDITKNLPVDLDTSVAARFVFDENYWKKRCLKQSRPRDNQISEHGLSWKQLFFENFVQEGLERYDGEGKDLLPPMLDIIEICQEYIFSLKVLVILNDHGLSQSDRQDSY